MCGEWGSAVVVHQTYYLKEMQKVLENLAVYTSISTNIDSTLLCRLDTSWYVQHNAATSSCVKLYKRLGQNLKFNMLQVVVKSFYQKS